MRLPPNEVLYRKRVGSLRGRPVIQVGGIGGIHVVAAGDDGEVLGAGVLPGLARHAARTSYPGIVFDDLQKSEEVSPETLAAGLEDALATTAILVQAWRDARSTR